MAEYYNTVVPEYELLLQKSVVIYRFRVELLDHYERSYMEITRDVSSSETFSININRSQGVRRTCTLNMCDLDSKYIPSVDNPFWYNRKFKLYIGVTNRKDTYWFPQGVFVCQKATGSRHSVNITGVDKFGFLDGSLNTHMIHETYKVEVDVPIGEMVRSLLMLELGNGYPIDPITPLIDSQLEKERTISEIVLDPGQYLGEILIQVASMIGADVYYDRNGRLIVERIFNDDLPFYYIHKGETWHFYDIHETYMEPSVDYELDGCNYVVVSTDNTEGEVYTYTAINDNPRSPVAVSKVGYRGNSDGAITYIPVGDTSIAVEAIDKCRQHAEYLLLQKTCPTITENFRSIIIPHLDVSQTVGITDGYFGWNDTSFLTQSITINGDADMSISVVNLQWLPTDTDSASLTLTNNIAHTITYNSGDSIYQAPPQQLILEGNYVKLFDGVTLNYSSNTFICWRDEDGNDYGYEYIGNYLLPITHDLNLTAIFQ